MSIKSIVTVAALGAGVVFSMMAPAESTSPSVADRAPDVTPASQRAALEDGVITRGEYRNAMAREAACLKGAVPGLDLQGPFWREDGLFMTYQYRVEGAEAHEAAEAAEMKCAFEHRHETEVVWGNQQRPSPDDAETLRSNLVDCLQEAGQSVSDDASRRDLASLQVDDNPGARGCMNAHARLFIS